MPLSYFRKRKLVAYSRLLVQEEHICASLEESVSSRETSETTADDDNLCHDYDVKLVKMAVEGRNVEREKSDRCVRINNSYTASANHAGGFTDRGDPLACDNRRITPCSARRNPRRDSSSCPIRQDRMPLNPPLLCRMARALLVSPNSLPPCCAIPNVNCRSCNGRKPSSTIQITTANTHVFAYDL